jgi:hypothetical protein
MARSRNLKPAFFTNEELARCSPLARLLFAGLWCLADRDGKLLDRPRRIKAEILPYEDIPDADALLAELEHELLLIRYEVGGERYIKVPTFAKHQRPHPKEPQSVIPEPCNYTASRGKVLSSRASNPLTSNPLTSSSDSHVPPDSSRELTLVEPSPVVAVLPCVGSGPSTYEVTQAQVDDWASSYPGVDVRLEVLKAKAWLQASPRRRKTHSGCPRFVVNWLSKAQNESRVVPVRRQPHRDGWEDSPRSTEWRDEHGRTLAEIQAAEQLVNAAGGAT